MTIIMFDIRTVDDDSDNAAAADYNDDKNYTPYTVEISSSSFNSSLFCSYDDDI